MEALLWAGRRSGAGMRHGDRGRVAIVGSASALAAAFGELCCCGEDRRPVVCFTPEAPPQFADEVFFEPTEPGALGEQRFVEHGVESAVFMPADAVGHRLVPCSAQSAGAEIDAFLRACEAADLKRVLVFVGVGVHAGNRERDPVPEGAAFGDADLNAIADGVREVATLRYARAHPECSVLVCRLAHVAGRGTHGLAAKLLACDRIPQPAGSAPRLQFVHVEDAAGAAYRLWSSARSGMYHVAPDDALGLDDIARLLRRPLVRFTPGVERLLRVARWVLRRGEVGGLAAELIPYLRGGVVLDNRKIQRDIGYVFRYTSASALSEQVRGG